MPLGMIVWFVGGFIGWITLAWWFGEIRIADIMIALMACIAGPLIPLIMGASYAGYRLEIIARRVIWRRKPKG